MTAYNEVDDVIAAWVKSCCSTLFTEWAGKPARYFHMPGAAPFECFQISVSPPAEGIIGVVARAIDTNDDTEMELEKTWDGPVAELNTMLASATETIQQWATRSQKSAS